MNKTVTLCVVNRDELFPKLYIIPNYLIENLNCHSHNSSPIYTAFKSTVSPFVPLQGSSFFILFLFCRNSYKSLAVLEDTYGSGKTLNSPNVPVTSCFWISHGLASIILISNDLSARNKTIDILRSIDFNLTGYEIWDVNNDGTFTSTYNILTNHKFTFSLNFPIWNYNDPELNVLINECCNCLNTLWSRASIYSPELEFYIKSIYDDIIDIINDIKCLDTMDKSSNSDEINFIIDKNDLFNIVVWKTRLIGELIEYNSVLSYTISQAFSGHIPILHNECQIRNHSLLGIGSSHKSLYSIYSLVSSAFSRVSVEKVCNLYSSFNSIPLNCNVVFKPSIWTGHNIDSINNLSDVNISHLTYFSGRGGYRETIHALISPLQILTSSDSVRWSLIVNTHEYMHAIIKSFLSVIFPYDLISDKDKINSLLNNYKISLHLNEKLPESYKNIKIIDFIRYLIIHYLHLTCVKGNKGEPFMSNLRNLSRKLTNLQDQSVHDVIKTKEFIVDEITADIFIDVLQSQWRNINEFLSHSIDFMYFYDSDPDLYVPAIWCSWSTIHFVFSNIEEYLLRTISVVAYVLEKDDAFYRFENSYCLVKNILDKINKNSNNPLIDKALFLLSNDEFKRLIGHCFQAPIILVDLAKKYLFFRNIFNELNIKKDNCDYENLNIGSYDYSPFSNPYLLIKNHLYNKISNNDFSFSKNELYNSIWLLLACSSAITDSI